MDTLTFNTLAIAGSIATLFLVCLVLRLPLAGYPAAHVGGGGRRSASSRSSPPTSRSSTRSATCPRRLTSVGLLAQVPCTAFLAWLLLGEPLTAVQVAGAAVVLAGIYVVNRETA